MSNPQQQVRAMLRGAQAAWLHGETYRALLRSMALPGTGPRAPAYIIIDDKPVRPYQLYAPQNVNMSGGSPRAGCRDVTPKHKEKRR